MILDQCDFCGQRATLDGNEHCIACAMWQARLDAMTAKHNEGRAHVEALMEALDGYYGGYEQNQTVAARDWLAAQAKEVAE